MRASTEVGTRHFYVPETMGTKFAPIAVRSMDKKLLELAEAARAMGASQIALADRG